MMKNPTVDGTYWVWRVPKDIDRNYADLLDWRDNAWQNDTSEFNDSVAHTREFAAWSGPIEKPFPPESEDEVRAEYARGRPGEVATAVIPPTPLPPEYGAGLACVVCGGAARDLRKGVGVCRDPQCVARLELAFSPAAVCECCGKAATRKAGETPLCDRCVAIDTGRGGY